MAIVIKPDEATIIKKEMLASFLADLEENKITKDYWKECKESKEIFSSLDLEKMKKMCENV